MSWHETFEKFGRGVLLEKARKDTAPTSMTDEELSQLYNISEERAVSEGRRRYVKGSLLFVIINIAGTAAVYAMNSPDHELPSHLPTPAPKHSSPTPGA